MDIDLKELVEKHGCRIEHFTDPSSSEYLNYIKNMRGSLRRLSFTESEVPFLVGRINLLTTFCYILRQTDHLSRD